MAAELGPDLEKDLRALARTRSTAGVFVDFDGCLAPIVEDPDEARPVPGVSAVLSRLADRFAVAAVVSGRPVGFLARRVRARGVRLVGLYGIEERVGGTTTIVGGAEGYGAIADRAADELRAAFARREGVFVEHKGLAVSVHFRRAPEPADAMRVCEPAVLEIAKRTGLHNVLRGKLVLELRPPVPTDKGTALRRIIRSERLTAALVVGDDTGDVDAFRAVESLERHVRVAVVSAEAPRELVRRADHIVTSPHALVAALRVLATATGL